MRGKFCYTPRGFLRSRTLELHQVVSGMRSQRVGGEVVSRLDAALRREYPGTRLQLFGSRGELVE